MNACTWASCQMCGRCTDEYEQAPEPSVYLRCDECGMDAFQPLSLAGVGVACSRRCLDVLARKHEAAMMREGA